MTSALSHLRGDRRRPEARELRVRFEKALKLVEKEKARAAEERRMRLAAEARARRMEASMRLLEERAQIGAALWEVDRWEKTARALESALGEVHQHLKEARAAVRFEAEEAA